MLGIAVGALAVVLARRLREVQHVDDAESLAEEIHSKLEALEARAKRQEHTH